MASENQPARNTTAEPAVPGPRPHGSGEPPEGGEHDGGQTAPPGSTAVGAAPSSDSPETAAPPQTAVPPQAPSQGPGSSEHVLARTRAGGTWVAIGCFAVVLLLLLVFILENGSDISLAFFGTHTRLPLGVALVLAAVCGALLVMFAGMTRIMQMRARVRKHRRAERKRLRIQ